MGDVPRVAEQEWNPKERLADLMMEAKFDDGDAAASVARLLREHSLIAAESLCHLSAYACNERVRFQASTYILDRVLGGNAEHDIKLRTEAVSVVGQVLHGMVRNLGMHYGFDPNSIEVRTIAHDAILALAGKS
jgi:hypothetical protein